MMLRDECQPMLLGGKLEKDNPPAMMAFVDAIAGMIFLTTP